MQHGVMQEVLAHLGSSTAHGLHLALKPLLLCGLRPNKLPLPTPKSSWEHGPREKQRWVSCLTATPPGPNQPSEVGQSVESGQSVSVLRRKNLNRDQLRVEVVLLELQSWDL